MVLMMIFQHHFLYSQNIFAMLENETIPMQLNLSFPPSFPSNVA